MKICNHRLGKTEEISEEAFHTLDCYIDYLPKSNIEKTYLILINFFGNSPYEAYQKAISGHVSILSEEPVLRLTDKEIALIAIDSNHAIDMEEGDGYPLNTLWFNGSLIDFARKIIEATHKKNGVTFDG